MFFLRSVNTGLVIINFSMVVLFFLFRILAY